MKFLKNLFLLVLAPLLLAEVVLRLFLFVRPVTPMTQTDSNIQKKAMNQFVQKKIDLLWNRELKDTKTFYEPPFQVFVNRGFGDSKRMADIAARSALPKNTVSTQQNFLRLNAAPDIGNFTVTSNSLGFRSAEHGEKQANDFRIITLGSYPAFGHGVNDFETYSYYLEEDLNRTSSGQHFEVWNGGRQGGTSIMGLARLQYEVGKYQPDLIIWDYGWIEMYLRADIVSSEEEMAGLRLVPMSSFTRFFYRNCNTFDFLALCRQLQKKI